MPLHIIGYAYGRAANNSDCEAGPLVIQQSSLLGARHLPIQWGKTLQSEDQHRKLEAAEAIAKIDHELASEVQDLVEKRLPFLVLGGDHSSAIGTWSGALNALEGPLGLLWIDAHLDSHTPETSISKNIHGMPLAALLGYGDQEFIEISKSKIMPENLVLIGARSFEEGEQVLLQNLGVKIFYMEDIEKKGLEKVMQEALKIISAHSSGFGISLDLDALDPRDAPGVGCREPNGISAPELLKTLKPLFQHPLFIGVEIAEFNPTLDEAQKTEELIVDLIEILC